MDEVRRGKKLAADLDARGALWLGIAVHSSGLQEESRVPWSRVPPDSVAFAAASLQAGDQARSSRPDDSVTARVAWAERAPVPVPVPVPGPAPVPAPVPVPAPALPLISDCGRHSMHTAPLSLLLRWLPSMFTSHTRVGKDACR